MDGTNNTLLLQIGMVSIKMCGHIRMIHLFDQFRHLLYRIAEVTLKSVDRLNREFHIPLSCVVCDVTENLGTPVILRLLRRFIGEGGTSRVQRPPDQLRIELCSPVDKPSDRICRPLSDSGVGTGRILLRTQSDHTSRLQTESFEMFT